MPFPTGKKDACESCRESRCKRSAGFVAIATESMVHDGKKKQTEARSTLAKRNTPGTGTQLLMELQHKYSYHCRTQICCYLCCVFSSICVCCLPGTPARPNPSFLFYVCFLLRRNQRSVLEDIPLYQILFYSVGSNFNTTTTHHRKNSHCTHFNDPIITLSACVQPPFNRSYLKVGTGSPAIPLDLIHFEWSNQSKDPRFRANLNPTTSTTTTRRLKWLERKKCDNAYYNIQ